MLLTFVTVINNSPPPKVCFVCLDAFGLFSPQSNIPFGGAQYRSFTLAMGMARHAKCTVSFLVYDYGQEQGKKTHGVTLFRTDSTRIDAKFGRGKRLQRKLFDRLNALLHCRGNMTTLYEHYYQRQDLLRTQADVFCIFGLTPTTLKQLRILKEYGKRAVVFLTHDEDVSSINNKGSEEINRHGIKGDLVWQILQEDVLFICQNHYQLERVRDVFKRPAFLLNNPIDMSGSCQTTGEFVLWVGRDTEVKRPKLFLELARNIPNQRFVMILNPSPTGDYRYIEQHKPENLELLPFVPVKEVEDYFKRARFLVNTSTSEGFPNTFLQAGKYSVPIMTLGIDPNNIITNNQCGYVFRDVHEMTAAFRSDPAFGDWQQKSLTIGNYVRNNHGLKEVSRRLLDALQYPL